MNNPSRSISVSAVLWGLISVSLLIMLSFSSAAASDECSSAQVITNIPSIISLSTASATSSGDPSTSCGYPLNNTVWFKYTPALNDTLQIDTFSSNFDTTLAVFKGDCGNLLEQACNDDYSGLQSKIDVNVSAGSNYYIMVGSYSLGGGNLTLNVGGSSTPTPPPSSSPNDEITDATSINNLPYYTTSDASLASSSPTDPVSSCFDNVEHSEWYSFTTTQAESVRVSAYSSYFNDATLTVFRGPINSLSEVGCSANAVQAAVDFISEPNETYYFMTGSLNGDQIDVNVEALSCTISPACPKDIGTSKSSLAISNAGEIIWLATEPTTGHSQIYSDQRGQLTTALVSGRTDPDINASGDVVWARYEMTPEFQAIWEVWLLTAQGGEFQIAPSNSREPAINDNGEIIWSQFNTQSGIWEIISSGRGLLSDPTVSAYKPDINNAGNVVWHQNDPATGFKQIFGRAVGESIVQISYANRDATEPTINDLGEIVWQEWDLTNEVYTLNSNRSGVLRTCNNTDYIRSANINNSGTIVYTHEDSTQGLTGRLIPGWKVYSTFQDQYIDWFAAPEKTVAVGDYLKLNEIYFKVFESWPGSWNGPEYEYSSALLQQVNQLTGAPLFDTNDYPLMAQIPCAKGATIESFKSFPGSGPVDSDGDGMTDAFESAYGLDPNYRDNLLNDYDEDGYGNFHEFTAGTDPGATTLPEPLTIEVAPTTGEADMPFVISTTTPREGEGIFVEIFYDSPSLGTPGSIDEGIDWAPFRGYVVDNAPPPLEMADIGPDVDPLPNQIAFNFGASYKFGSLALGNYIVRVTNTQGDITEASFSVTAPLSSTFPINGVVYTSAGVAPAGSLVWLGFDDWHGTIIDCFSFTEPDGSFTLRVPSKAQYVGKVGVVLDGYLSPLPYEVYVDGGSTYLPSLYLLEADTSVEGKIVSIDDLRPASFAQIEGYHDGMGWTSRAYADFYGNYSLPVISGDEWSIAFNDYPPQTFGSKEDVTGFYSRELKITPTLNPNRADFWSLGETATLKTKVLTEDGKLVERAAVVATSDPNVSDPLHTDLENYAVSDSLGDATVGVRDGDWKVAINFNKLEPLVDGELAFLVPGSLTAISQQEGQTQNLNLTAYFAEALVTGYVYLDDGITPAPFAQVEATTNMAYEGNPRYPLGSITTTVTSDPTGKYTLPLLHGDWTLNVTDYDHWLIGEKTLNITTDGDHIPENYPSQDIVLTQPTVSLSVGGDGPGGGDIASVIWEESSQDYVKTDIIDTSVGNYAADYQLGDEVILMAYPDGYSSIAGWTVNGEPACGPSYICYVSIDQAMYVTVTFADDRRSLTVGNDGAGAGDIASVIWDEPSQDYVKTDIIDTSVGNSTENYLLGDEVMLMAYPDDYSSVAGWIVNGEPACGPSYICYVSIDQAKTVTATFDLLPAQLTSPVHLDLVTSGLAQNVSWTSMQGVSEYGVYYSLDGQNWKNITTTSSLTAGWNVPSVAVSTSCILAVNSYDSQGTLLGQDTITVTIQPSQAIQFTSHTGGETFLSTTTEDLVWNAATGAQSYKVFYALNGGGWKLAGTTSSANFRFEVPGVVTSSSCVIAVNAYDAVGAFLNQDTIAVTVDSPQTVQITSHAGGETFISSTNEGLVWNAATGAQSYKVFYALNGGGWRLAGTTGSANFSFEVPGVVTSSSCVIAVNAYDAVGAFLNQDTIAVTVDSPQTVQITSHASGETFISSTNEGLAWNAATGAQSYKVFYALNGGGWKLAGTTNSPSYGFTVPVVATSSSCIVAVNAYDTDGAFLNQDMITVTVDP